MKGFYGEYRTRRSGAGREEPTQQPPEPIWDEASQPNQISSEHIIERSERKATAEEVRQIRERHKLGIATEFSSILSQLGIKLDPNAVSDLVGKNADGRITALASDLSRGDFSRLVRDFAEIGSAGDGGPVSKDNIFLPFLTEAGGRVEEVSDENLGKTAEKSASRGLRTNYVKVYGGQALVNSAYGLNIAAFIVDVGILKSIVDYGLTSAAAYAGPEIRSAFSWMTTVAANAYLAYGKAWPERMLDPRTVSGRVHTAAFAGIAAVSLSVLSAAIVSSEDRAKIAIEVGAAEKKIPEAIRKGVKTLHADIAAIKPTLKPLIQARTHAIALEGTADTDRSRGADASKTSDASEKRMQRAQEAVSLAKSRLVNASEKNRQAREKALAKAEKELAQLMNQATHSSPPEATVARGGDTPPNGPKSWTAWAATYGSSYKISGTSITEYGSSITGAYEGFTVSASQKALTELASEFGLKPGEGMIALLDKLTAEIENVDMSKLEKEKADIESLVKQLSPSRWKYILGPIYDLSHGDFSAAMFGSASVEDLFAKNPELQKVAKNILADLKKVHIQSELERYQARVKEVTGLDLGIQFPAVNFSLTDQQIEGWTIDREKYADILSRSNWYYLSHLNREHLPILAAVLVVLFGTMGLIAATKRVRRKWNEDNLSGYEAQEFEREGEIAKALADDLARREASVYAKLNKALTSQPVVSINAGRIEVDLGQETLAPRSPERLENILRRGMRIASVSSLPRPEGVSEDEWQETVRAFVERRPRRGVFGRERRTRAHLGTKELAQSYHAALDAWTRQLSSAAGRETALRQLRQEIARFDGPDADRDSALDSLEMLLSRGTFSRGQIRDLYDRFDGPFLQREAVELLNRVKGLATQRRALIEEGAGRNIRFGPGFQLTNKDLVLTQILTEIDDEMDYNRRLYAELIGIDEAFQEAVSYDGEMDKDARTGFAKRMQSFYEAERSDEWAGQRLSDLVTSHRVALTSVSEKITNLEAKAREGLGADTLGEVTIEFSYPYDVFPDGTSGRRIEVSAYHVDGTEVASLSLPYRVPSPELDSDEKILKAVDAFFSADSIELRLAKGEARMAAMERAIEALEESLPAEIQLPGGLEDELASRIDELLRREDIVREQGLALSRLKQGGRLSSLQDSLFGDDPLSVPLSSLWNKGIRPTAERIADQHPGASVILDIPNRAIKVTAAGSEEIIPIRE